MFFICISFTTKKEFVMKLKKDWSLAHFLYYLCWIGYWAIILNIILKIFVTVSFSQIGTYYIDDLHVNLKVEHFDQYRDIELEDLSVMIPEVLEARVGISTSLSNNTGAFLFYLGLILIEQIIYFFILFLFSKMLKNVAEGRPFAEKNPTYLFAIGWILFLSSIANIGISFLPMPLLQEGFLSEEYSFSSLHFMRDYMLEGIFIIVLGYVFKEGARIYQEQKLTV